VTDSPRLTRVLSTGLIYLRLLLLCCLSLAVPVAAGWDLQGESLSAGELEPAFEVEVYHQLQQRLGVDAVVLNTAGIRREVPVTTGVVAARTRDWGGKPVPGHAQALDRDTMRIAAQGGVLNVLLPDDMLQSDMLEILLRVPGVKSVRFCRS